MILPTCHRASMRGSKGGRREGICSSKLKVVPKDRLQVGLHLQAAFVTLQTTRSWRWRNRGADKGGDEGLEELTLLLLDDLRHGLDHPGEAELGGGLVELLLGGEEGEQEVGFLQVWLLQKSDEEILKGLQLRLKHIQSLATKEFSPGGYHHTLFYRFTTSWSYLGGSFASSNMPWYWTRAD